MVGGMSLQRDRFSVSHDLYHKRRADGVTPQHKEQIIQRGHRPTTRLHDHIADEQSCPRRRRAGLRLSTLDRIS